MDITFLGDSDLIYIRSESDPFGNHLSLLYVRCITTVTHEIIKSREIITSEVWKTSCVYRMSVIIQSNNTLTAAHLF